MHTSTLASTVLLLASAVTGQSTTARLSFNPGGPINTASATACVQVCVQGACRPCSTSDGIMSIPPGETPISMGSTWSSPSAFSPVRSHTSVSVSAATSVSSGQTPLSTAPFSTGSKASAATSKSALQSASGASPTSSAVPAQTSNAASPAFNNDGTSFVLAVAGAAFAFL